MRVLFSHYLASDDHPATRAVHAVAEALRDRGHVVRVHRSEGPAADAASAGRPANPLCRGLWFARAVARNRGSLRRDGLAIESFRPEVVLCRQDAYRMSMPLACRRAGVPLVTYADAPVAYEARHVNPHARWHPPGVAERIEGWGLRQSRAVVTVSRTAARLLDGYRLRAPVVVAPNGVDVDRFRPASPAEREATRLALGVTTPLAVGFLGTFRPFHGLDLLGRVVREVTARRRDVTWLLAGDGPGREQLRADVGGCPNVRFLGRLPADEVANLVPALDVLICPRQTAVPEFYFSPLKVLEGMASGVACLASDQGDMPELLAHGAAGRLVAGDDPRTWADALTRLLDRPGVRNLMGQAARRRAETVYTWADTAARVEVALSAGVGHRPLTSHPATRTESRRAVPSEGLEVFA